MRCRPLDVSLGATIGALASRIGFGGILDTVMIVRNPPK